MSDLHPLLSLFLRLSDGLCDLNNSLDPEKIIIGGGLSAVGDLLFEERPTYAATHALNTGGRQTIIEPTVLGKDAGTVGATTLVMLPLVMLK